MAKAEARLLTESVRKGAAPPSDWAAALRERVMLRQRPELCRVINATGVVLHTNLGRAPLSARAAAAVQLVAEGWSTLELNLDSGQRGERMGAIASRLQRLTGGQAAIAVNNNAAAVLLALTAIASGKEVIVSRGQLVEIGGSFRIPDVISAGGAKLVEVGTTNRTRLADYERAISAHTAAILWVHPSNFRVEGFTESANRTKLYTLAKSQGIPLLDDLGSGALAENLGEPTVTESLATADLVMFSGDKLLGGPQAGILVGQPALVEQARKHPLYRALRLDRLVLAALEATLIDYEVGQLPPAPQLLLQTASALAKRARSLHDSLAKHGLNVALLSGSSLVGAGSAPGTALPTTLVALSGVDPDSCLRALRLGTPPVVARVAEDRLLFDPRTILPDEEPLLVEAVCRAAAATPTR